MSTAGGFKPTEWPPQSETRELAARNQRCPFAAFRCQRSNRFGRSSALCPPFRCDSTMLAVFLSLFEAEAVALRSFSFGCCNTAFRRLSPPFTAFRCPFTTFHHGPAVAVAAIADIPGLGLSEYHWRKLSGAKAKPRPGDPSCLNRSMTITGLFGGDERPPKHLSPACSAAGPLCVCVCVFAQPGGGWGNTWRRISCPPLPGNA